MNFGSFWHNIYQAPMNSAATKVSGSSSNIAYDPAGDHEVEGSYLYKFGDYYYLFYSKGKCCGYDSSRPPQGGEYKIMVCRSSDVTGGFVSLPGSFFGEFRLLMCLQVDKNGVSCTNGGGTVVLESHGTVYGPGGQYVFSFLPRESVI